MTDDNWPPYLADAISIMRHPCPGVDERVVFPDGSRCERSSPDGDAVRFTITWRLLGFHDSMAAKWIDGERSKWVTMEAS